MSTQPPADRPQGTVLDAAARGEDRGVVTGDRLCVGCGFNLHGQTIAREPHYNMLCVRCPECSAVAALQEYPVLGRWAQRVGLLLAVGWSVVVLGLAFLTGISLYAGAQTVATAATLPAARQIGAAFREYAIANEQPAGSGSIYAQDMGWTTYSGDTADYWVDPAWLEAQDLAAVSAPAINGRTVASAIPLVLGAAVWGAVWSVLLLHRRLLARLVYAGLIAAFVAAVLILVHMGRDASVAATAWNPFAFSYAMWSWGVPARQVASSTYGLPAGLSGCVIGFLAMAVGLAPGRRMARLLVRVLLPPHLRGALAMLWHVDGLPSPPTRGELWLRG